MYVTGCRVFEKESANLLCVFAPCSRALQEAQDIFGVDFDFDEFSKYQDEYDEEMEEEEVHSFFFSFFSKCFHNPPDSFPCTKCRTSAGLAG